MDGEGRPPEEVAELIEQRIGSVDEKESNPDSIELLRAWCRTARTEISDAIAAYDEGNWAGLDPFELGPHPVSKLFTDLSNRLADVGAFALAEEVNSCSFESKQHAVSLLMKAEQWCSTELSLNPL